MAKIDINTLEEKLNDRNSKGRKNKSAKKGMDLLFAKKPQPLVEETVMPDGVVEEKTEPQEAIEKIEVIEKRVEVASKPKHKKIIKKTNTKKKKNKESKKLDTTEALKVPSKKFMKVQNSLIESLVMSNMSGNELKFVLLILKETIGWNRPYCVLSKPDIESTGITSNLIYKTRNSLKENGVIEFGKDPDSTKTFYYLKKSFFVSDEEMLDEFVDLEGDNTVASEVFSSYLESKNVLPKVRESESKRFEELISNGKSETEIIELAKYLDENGMHDGSTCSLPISFLASGAYDSVIERVKSSPRGRINAQLIYEAVTNSDQKQPLPEKYKEQLSEADMEWIENHGGRFTLSQSQTLRKDLGLK